MALFGLAGVVGAGLNIQGTSSFIRRLPDAQRAQGGGLLSSGLVTVQGLGALLAGVFADQIGPAHTIALAGAAGAIVAIPLALGWNRARSKQVDLGIQ
jgi:MFS family permease